MSKKVKYYCAKQVVANINIVNINNIEVNDNNFAKDKALVEMLKYLQTKDIVNYNNAIFDIFNILEKPMQYHLQTNKNDNYLLVNIIDILCHHHVLNPLHLINYLFNNCHNQRCPQQNYDNDRHKNNNAIKSIKSINVFNKIIINDSTPKNNLFTKYLLFLLFKIAKLNNHWVIIPTLSFVIAWTIVVLSFCYSNKIFKILLKTNLLIPTILRKYWSGLFFNTKYVINLILTI